MHFDVSSGNRLSTVDQDVRHGFLVTGVMSQRSVRHRLRSMEPADRHWLRAMHVGMLWETLLGNAGAMLKAAVSSELWLWRDIEVPAPEPSRVEWEDTH